MKVYGNMGIGDNMGNVDFTYFCDNKMLLDLTIQTISRDATPQSGKIRKFEKCQNVANKCIKWSIVV